MRLYVLTKLSAGDYLVPSNDGELVYRLSTYEDGPSFGLDDWPADRTLWRIRSIPRLELLELVDFDGAWAEVSDGHATRRAALESLFGPDVEAGSREGR